MVHNSVNLTYFDFYKDKFVRFSSLSYKQQQMKIKINDNILRGMKKDDIYAEDTSAIDSKKLKKKVSIVHLKNKALKLKGKGYAGKKVIYVAIGNNRSISHHLKKVASATLRIGKGFIEDCLLKED